MKMNNPEKIQNCFFLRYLKTRINNYIVLPFDIFLANHLLIFGPIWYFCMSSFPTRIAPTQNIFDAISRIVIATAAVFIPNFKKGNTMIIPQKIQDNMIRPKPRIRLFFMLYTRNEIRN
jgi:hypothetical protein